MRGGRGWRSLACALGFLAALLLWRPVAGIAGDALAATKLAVVARKAAPAKPPPGRLRNVEPPAKLYFGPRAESVTTGVAPQNPYEPNYTSTLRAYHKAIIGFHFALTARAYLFVGVGMAISGDLLEQGLDHNSKVTAAQIQNALAMQTEYGLGWDF